MENRKVVIIGDGAVGSSTAFALLQGNAVNEIVIIDVNKNKAEGDVLDMQHGISFVSPKIVKAGDYSDCKDAHIIVITAGVAQKEGETRIDLLKRNIKVFDSIIESMRPYLSEEVIILVVTNPVDVLSYYVNKKLNLAPGRVIGSGTVLDTSRLKYLISEDTGVDPRNIHTYVVGEHGDSEVATFSITTIGGVNLEDYCATCKRCACHGKLKFTELLNEVKHAAYDIISKKGATYYAVALAVNRIVEAIVNNTNSILTVSTLIEDAYDGRIKDVYLSLPNIVNRQGASRMLTPKFSAQEVDDLVKSSDELKKIIRQIGE
ncbi:MAG: L-lactate dehydrogenase [Bacteroidia bacterium]|nr:L-lactate dehydrogenase [Bacteroidia bacterium]